MIIPIPLSLPAKSIEGRGENHYGLFVIVISAFVVLGCQSGLLFATPTIPPDELISLAKAGVESNAMWKKLYEENNGVKMALVPAGCFLMGHDNSKYPNEKPAHKVCFEEPFWIDVTEVTNAQYGGASDIRYSSFFGETDCRDYSSGDSQPRICVNWFEASDFCNRRGARLPTEAEWEYAARGPDNLLYTWGNTFDDNAVIWNATKTAKVGSKPDGASWVGAMDMAGNVGEWVNDMHDAEYYGSSPIINPQGPETVTWYMKSFGEQRVYRGGTWFNTTAESFYVFTRSSQVPDLYSIYTGFRCAKSFHTS